MPNQAGEFWASTASYRRRFGLLRGLRLGLQLRDWTRPPGEVYEVAVPGLPHPPKLRAGTTDRAVLRQILAERELDFPMSGEPKLVIDAGANIGLSSVFFADRFPSATVVALEIDTGNYDLLCRNVAPYPSIRPMRAALWSGRGYVRIANPDADAWSYRAVAADAGDPGAIPAVGVADLVAEYGPIDLLKMDIEGGELDVFSADTSWISDVRVLAVELHDRFRPGCREAVERVVGRDGFSATKHGEYVVFRRSGSGGGGSGGGSPGR